MKGSIFSKSSGLIAFLLLIASFSNLFANDDTTLLSVDLKASNANIKADGNNSRIQALEQQNILIEQKIDLLIIENEQLNTRINDHTQNIDSTPPIVTHDAPTIVYSPDLAINFSISDDRELAYYVIQDEIQVNNSKQVVLFPGTSEKLFVINKSLSSGSNNFLVMAVDRVGNSTTVSVSIEAQSLLSCNDIKTRSPSFTVACNSNTAVGYYWQVGAIQETYGYWGLTNSGIEPACNADTVGSTAQTAAWSATTAEQGFWPVHTDWCKTAANQPEELLNPGCSYEGGPDWGLCGEHCGIYLATCAKAP